MSLSHTVPCDEVKILSSICIKKKKKTQNRNQAMTFPACLSEQIYRSQKFRTATLNLIFLSPLGYLLFSLMIQYKTLLMGN